jgi:hypothetical protein
MGRFFGPITTVWFITMGALGAVHASSWRTPPSSQRSTRARRRLHDRPQISDLYRVGAPSSSPSQALKRSTRTWVTSAASPIRVAWIGLVLPALTLNYLGQGAFVLGQSRRAEPRIPSRTRCGPRRWRRYRAIRFQPILRNGAGHAAPAAGHSGDGRDRDREPGRDLRCVLADPAGHSTGPAAAHGDQAARRKRRPARSTCRRSTGCCSRACLC